MAISVWPFNDRPVVRPAMTASSSSTMISATPFSERTGFMGCVVMVASLILAPAQPDLLSQQAGFRQHGERVVRSRAHGDLRLDVDDVRRIRGRVMVDVLE